jgi:U3 small nucleolar RNA-associated protein 14
MPPPLDLTQHEAEEYRVRVDGGNDEDREELRVRLIGESGENEGIESGDDD